MNIARPTTNDLQNLYRGSLVHLISEDKPTFVSIFRKNGVSFPVDASDDAFYAAVMAGMLHSASLKRDVNNYVKSRASNEVAYSNADGGTAFGNFLRGIFGGSSSTTPATAPVTTPTATTTSSDSTLSQTLTPQRLGNYFDSAVNLLVSSLGSKVQQKGEQNAIDYELAQAKKYQAVGDAGAATTGAVAQKKILVPVLITVSVLFVAGLVYYVVSQRRKKARMING